MLSLKGRSCSSLIEPQSSTDQKEVDGGEYMIKREHSMTKVQRHGNQRTWCIQRITNIWLDWDVTSEVEAGREEAGKVKMGQQVLRRLVGGLLIDMCSTLLVLIKDFK